MQMQVKKMATTITKMEVKMAVCPIVTTTGMTKMQMMKTTQR